MNMTQKKAHEHERLEQILEGAERSVEIAGDPLPMPVEGSGANDTPIKLGGDFATGKQTATEATTKTEEKKPRKKSSQQTQAEQVAELLKQGPITIDQLKQINPAYPSDAIGFAKKLLNLKIRTNRAKGGKTTYELEK